MIQHLWTVLCSRSIIDEETQNLTLLDVLEQITVPAALFAAKEPMLPLRFEVVTMWLRQPLEQPERGQARLRLLAPNGKSIQEQAYQIDLSQYPRSRTRIRVPNLPIPSPGQYVFIVEIAQNNATATGWQEVSRVPLQISQEKA